MKNLISRIILFGLIFFVYEYKITTNLYSIISSVLMIFGVYITYKEDRESNIYNIVSNYLFWVFLSITVFTIKQENVLNLYNIFARLLVIKLIPLIITFIKFKKIEVPSTFLSKVWIFTIFLYMVELLYNSTHGLKNLFYYTGIISSIELVFILLKVKEWKPKINSVVSLFKQ
ncbi:hypothetical protein EV195_10951 [Tenacibaculum skagerrakense]|uniref:Uncharacterized protein n=1 Tax=Tenacibaculum skagerrakense TaxID=186571 RepID=A0A4R2NNQ1_9FLAO|nr:hypothetical protein [Tenacibaculum skagerrakense]TCP23327.1 hypothetical protein EV195_10951 [Tenacibaculum skagerrakense]